MINEQHPIVPSEGLKEEWESEWHHYRGQDTYEEFMARQAAQWGADQELEACCEWLNKGPYGASLAVNGVIEQLRAARRPKAQSLKEQALDALQSMRISPELIAIINANTDLKDKYETIRCALETL